ncbi:hypothetical protein B9Z19DRAFT_1119863 [Tuber borchii]|uniref:Uncharacterized protein n=1 Tax=Tuber borchii TaxID=42251 RepID=A0A2T7A5N6_TUBBO|nr:hypothetical protein B9Z19DRAFT_1119863 [Tuber borchii]
MCTVSSSDSRAPDYETVERRYNIAVNLESWELLAMHSIAGDEVKHSACAPPYVEIARRPLHSRGIYPPTPPPPAAQASSGSAGSGRKRLSREQQ